MTNREIQNATLAFQKLPERGAVLETFHPWTLTLDNFKKDGLPEIAREIIEELKFEFYCQYDEKDSIGKRYRRHDAIGTPFCVTVDHQSATDQTVTIRHRDTMEQERVKISELKEIIGNQVSMKDALKKLSR